MAVATTVPDVLIVNPVCYPGEGRIAYLETSCHDHDDYLGLPRVIRFNGTYYGLTSWNSDACKACYKTGVHFAQPV